MVRGRSSAAVVTLANGSREMSRRRVARLNEQLKREITELLRYKVKDPRVGMATVTEVSTAPDLSFARVYISVIGEDAEKAEVLEGLRAAAPFIRGELGRRLRVRRVPELDIQLDRSLEQALRIEKLLAEVRPAPDEDQIDTGPDEGSDARDEEARAEHPRDEKAGDGG
jgi:ribosome-binding factor A